MVQNIFDLTETMKPQNTETANKELASPLDNDNVHDYIEPTDKSLSISSYHASEYQPAFIDFKEPIVD